MGKLSLTHNTALCNANISLEVVWRAWYVFLAAPNGRRFVLERFYYAAYAELFSVLYKLIGWYDFTRTLAHVLLIGLVLSCVVAGMAFMLSARETNRRE